MTRIGLWLLAAALGLPTTQAAAGKTRPTPEAADLEEAFAHDLCTRDDRALRTLNRALARGMQSSPAHGRYAPKP